jgi:hypothetical protein
MAGCQQRVLGRNQEIHTEVEKTKDQSWQTCRRREKDFERDTVRAADWLPVEDAPTRVLRRQHNASVFPVVGQARGIPKNVGALPAGV